MGQAADLESLSGSKAETPGVASSESASSESASLESQTQARGTRDSKWQGTQYGVARREQRAGGESPLLLHSALTESSRDWPDPWPLTGL